MKIGLWYNSKMGAQGFTGSYEFKDKSRYLVLTGEKTGRRVEVESHELAKAAGWKKFDGTKPAEIPALEAPVKPVIKKMRPDGTWVIKK